MIQVNTKVIQALDPCQDRLMNWIENYKDFDDSLETFLDLDQITHEDKLWVYFRLLDKSKIPLVAADFAEQVLHLYEAVCPNDNRPNKAIEAARGINKTTDDAADAAAYYAAYAAYAAAYAAEAAAHAAYAAAYAAEAAARAADAAYYAANAADAAARAAGRAVDPLYFTVMKEREEEAQITIMKGYLK